MIFSIEVKKGIKKGKMQRTGLEPVYPEGVGFTVRCV